jgi:hypothetical protein
MFLDGLLKQYFGVIILNQVSKLLKKRSGGWAGIKIPGVLGAPKSWDIKTVFKRKFRE